MSSFPEEFSGIGQNANLQMNDLNFMQSPTNEVKLPKSIESVIDQRF